MVNAYGIPISEVGQSSGASSMICNVSVTSPIPDMHALNLSDKKSPRMEDEEANSPHCTKKQKFVPELTLDYFPKHVLDLELLPKDIMDGAEVSDAPINSPALPTLLGSKVRLQGPPALG